jgi:hypothetical protein
MELKEKAMMPGPGHYDNKYPEDNGKVMTLSKSH